MILSPFDLIALVLALAALIGCVNQLYFGLPRSISLLIGSLGISLVLIVVDGVGGYDLLQGMRTVLSQADLPHVFMDGTVAFLLFAGSLHVNVADLRENKWLILVLATASVVLATALFGGGLWLVFQVISMPVPLAWCAVAGAILAPTDAVVVDTVLRQLNLPPQLSGAIVGESLFNDGAGVILFLITLEIANGQTGLIGHGRVALALLLAIGGGGMLGAASGYLAAWVMRRVVDDGLRLTISLALVISVYRLAHAADVSGAIAVVTAGLVISSMLPSLTGADRRSVVVEFWQFLDELLNAMLFVLIGFQISEVTFSRLALLPTLSAIPLAMASRLASIIIPAISAPGGWQAGVRRVSVLTWAGLRGGISVALALTLPESLYREQLLTISYVVVVFTIIVQGLTIPRVIRWLYHTPPISLRVD